MNYANTDTKNIKGPIHLIGIGGTGMSPLAEIALHRGLAVTGSDIGQSQVTMYLESLGAKIFSDHVASNIAGAGTVVISSAIKQDNPELAAAYLDGIPVIHRSDFLQFLMIGKKSITVSGTHGKTTTSALIAHMLYKLGLNPSAAIGGRLVEFGTSALCGDGDFFVAEADESDGSLLKYSPHVSVITNIDKDHLDFFKDIDDILRYFERYLKNTSPEGKCIIGWGNKNSQELGKNLGRDIVSFGQRIGSEVRLLHSEKIEGGIEFEFMAGKSKLSCILPLYGEHNVLNALCAISVAYALELDVQKAALTLRDFKGVARRLEPTFYTPDLIVFDDYAHNPGKISACISGLRETFATHVIHVIYQPHRYSRLETMYMDTVTAFTSADEVVVLPVYAAGERLNASLTPEKLAIDIGRHSKTKTKWFDDFPSCAQYVKIVNKTQDIFLCLGAGDISQFAHNLGALFHEESQKNHKYS